jgi:ubiquitin
LVNHNGKFPQGLPETNKKRKLTNKERYGDENYNNFEQRLITNEERYGDPYYTN